MPPDTEPARGEGQAIERLIVHAEEDAYSIDLSLGPGCDGDDHRGMAIAARADLATLQARIRSLEAHLLKYGRHDRDCPPTLCDPNNECYPDCSRLCTCGLSAALGEGGR